MPRRSMRNADRRFDFRGNPNRSFPGIRTVLERGDAAAVHGDIGVGAPGYRLCQIIKYRFEIGKRASTHIRREGHLAKKSTCSEAAAGICDPALYQPHRGSAGWKGYRIVGIYA